MAKLFKKAKEMRSCHFLQEIPVKSTNEIFKIFSSSKEIEFYFLSPNCGETRAHEMISSFHRVIDIIGQQQKQNKIKYYLAAYEQKQKIA